ncbi:hypothetical protein CEXT_680871 [Caerostris extrusa]|uniref:Uncharacterized protein n=1 Tax=Caerostris extrusa TaxID=172846 RepID=A0AAV4X4G0_CAEEX|nr:hypothetical protein CEXT_680871 [Caerostris extrusa]
MRRKLNFFFLPLPQCLGKIRLLLQNEKTRVKIKFVYACMDLKKVLRVYWVSMMLSLLKNRLDEEQILNVRFDFKEVGQNGNKNRIANVLPVIAFCEVDDR